MLDLVARGYDNRRIARTLFLSDKTVRNNVSTIFSKLGGVDRAEAVFRARAPGSARNRADQDGGHGDPDGCHEVAPGGDQQRSHRERRAQRRPPRAAAHMRTSYGGSTSPGRGVANTSSGTAISKAACGQYRAHHR